MADYSTQWHEYKRLRNIYIGVLIAFLPTMFLVMLIDSLTVKSEVIPFLAFFGYGIAALIAGARFNGFRCPRCGKWFRIYAWWWSPGFLTTFTRKCVHCGLPKYANE